MTTVTWDRQGQDSIKTITCEATNRQVVLTRGWTGPTRILFREAGKADTQNTSICSVAANDLAEVWVEGR